MRHTSVLPAVLARGLAVGVVSLASARAARAQATPHHPVVCANGVRTYSDIKEVPTPHDTVTLPPLAEPVRVTNDQEAEAADLAMRARAGSVGATGLIISDDTQSGGGGMTIRRHVVAVFVPSDSARAHKACGA